MRKVIGIGETILDILFRDGQPQAAVPGGIQCRDFIGTHGGKCNLHQ